MKEVSSRERSHPCDPVIVLIVVMTAVVLYAVKRVVNSDKPLLSYSKPAKGTVNEVITTIPPALRPFLYEGCSDGEEAGWYYLVVKYTCRGVENTEISMRGTRSRNLFDEGKKVNLLLEKNQPRLCIVA